MRAEAGAVPELCATDRVLIARESQGTAQVRQRLRHAVTEHFDLLWKFLRQLGIPEPDVDDAVQEVVIVAARRLHEVEEGRERAFLLGTAVRVASTVRRTLRRRREAGDEALQIAVDDGPTPEEVVGLRRARELLDLVLEDMPIELRAVFVLHELDELTMAQIAVSLELAPGTVASRLRRARALFEHRARQLEAELPHGGGAR
jgi:RNA polymerase sigma-70 factor (ECF subfamily)